MRPETWVEDVLGTRAKIRVLRLLASDPGKTRTEREIATQAGISTGGAHAALRQLRDAGVLEFRRVGRTHAIRLRRDAWVAREIAAIFGRERRTLDEVAAAARRATPRGAACLLFGSTARGEPGAGSDIDILVVAPTKRQAEAAAADVSRAVVAVLPVRTGMLALGAAELRRRRSQPWLQAALRDGRDLGRTPVRSFL